MVKVLIVVKFAFDLFSLGIGMPIESMQEFKCFQTLLVRSESLLRNAVDTYLMVNHSDLVLQIMTVCI